MIIVVIAMAAMMGAAAFAIDVGAAWSLRRDLVTATDSAALAAAADFAQGIDGCAATDDFFVQQNAPGATVVSCTPTGGATGFVTVEARQDSPAWFGRVIGQSDFDVPSFSGAKWGQLSAGTGLRPFGLCAANPAGGSAPPWLAQLQAFVAAPTSPTTIQIVYGNDAQTDPCNTGGSSPSNGAGNWGTVNLQRPVVCAPSWDPGHPCPNGAASNQDLASWTANGYERPIDPGTLGQTCATEPAHCWYGDTGANFNSGPVRNALNSLISSGDQFVLPLLDSSSGNGANLQYHIFGLVNVQVLDYCFNNCSPATPPPTGCNLPGGRCEWYITLRLSPGIGTGLCCDANPSTGVTVKGTTLCAVDPTDTSGC